MKPRVGPKLLLACLVSAVVPLGLAIWLVAAQGWDLGRPGATLTVSVILAAGVSVAALAAALAGFGRQAPVFEPPPQSHPKPATATAGDDGAEAWRQADLELSGALATKRSLQRSSGSSTAFTRWTAPSRAGAAALAWVWPLAS